MVTLQVQVMEERSGAFIESQTQGTEGRPGQQSESTCLLQRGVASRPDKGFFPLAAPQYEIPAEGEQQWTAPTRETQALDTHAVIPSLDG